MKAYFDSPRDFVVVIAVCAIVIICHVSIATAGDDIVVGTLSGSGILFGTDLYTGGEVITVNEDAPGTQLEYRSYVSAWGTNVGGVRCLSRGYVDPTYGPTVNVGLGFGYPVVLTPIDNGFTSPATTSFAGYWNTPYYDGVDTIASKPDGTVLVGIGGGMQNETVGGGEIYAYAVDKTNLAVASPTITGQYYNTSLRGATGYGLDFTEMECISDATIVSAIHNIVTLSDGYDMYESSTGGFPLTSEYTGVRQIGFNDNISAMAVTSTGQVVTGLHDGYVDIRNMNDLATILASVTLSSTISELEILPNGNIVAGLANGDVTVLSAAALAQISSVNFGAAIGGLGATSTGNIAIGSGSMLYVRSGADLSSGSAGVDMGSPIGAIVAISTAPTSCEEAIANNYGFDTDLNGDCYVNLGDFAKFAELWQNCIDPANANCVHPWE